MSVLIGEIVVCGQRTGGDVQLRIFGDEFYARYETLDGYTVVFDEDHGSYCYAILASGRFVSSGVPIPKRRPTRLMKHLKEDPLVRNEKFEQNYNHFRPREVDPDSSRTRVLGPDDGLLTGRKLHRGTVRGLTIIVDFDDVTTNITRSAVDEMFNSANYSTNGNFCSINKYFDTVSSGKLNYVNTVVGPVKLSKRRSHYISNSLVKEALDKAIADFSIDLSDFDSKGEGIVDAVNFLYAGNSQYNGELWPHNSVQQHRYGNTRTHYYQLTGLGSQLVDLRIGTICHENGHLLCRFPDMYDYGKRDGDLEKSQGIGRYCLMGSGNHLNERRTPSPVCSYLRELVGWVDQVVMLDFPGKFTASHSAFNTIWKYGTSIPNEYFLVENRSQIGLDAHLPSSGLAIYHCDTLGSNEWQDGTRNKHYQCALLQADGSLDLENNRNAGDFSDLFSNTTGVTLSDTTTPSTRAWNGTDSGLVLSEVTAAGPNITFTVGEPQDQPVSESETAPDMLIPDNEPTGATSILSLDSPGTIVDVSLDVEIIHSWISDLEISLITPGGTKIILHDHEGSDGDDIRQTYDGTTSPGLKNLVGKTAGGNWSLVIVDTASADVGRLLRWGIRVHYEKPDTAVTGAANPNLPIPDNDNEGISSNIEVQQDGDAKNIAVNINIEHTYIGDLRIDLTSPSGLVATLHNQEGAGSNNIKKTYDTSTSLALNGITGEPIRGTWRLRVRDLAGQDVGTLVSWGISIEL